MAEGKEYEVDGHRLTCPICGNNRFETHRTLLNRTWLTIFRLQAWDRTVVSFSCTSCGYILPFLRKQ